jgi:hypothetical protein
MATKGVWLSWLAQRLTNEGSRHCCDFQRSTGFAAYISSTGAQERVKHSEQGLVNEPKARLGGVSELGLRSYRPASTHIRRTDRLSGARRALG